MQRPASSSLALLWQRDDKAPAPVAQGRRRTVLSPGEWLVCDGSVAVEAPRELLRIELPRTLFLTPGRTLNALLLRPLACRGPALIAAELLAAAREDGAPLAPALHEAIAALADQALNAESEALGLRAGRSGEPEVQRTQLQAYLIERLSDRALSMDRVAEAFGMSRRSLYKAFEAWGTTPRAFLHNAKLDRACTLLRQAAAPVARVAEECGFSDPAHFSRAFQARHGTPPSTWRAMQG